MFLLEKIDSIGRPAWIALTILGFWIAWPLGLATLMFVALSGRFRGVSCSAPGRWYNTANSDAGRRGCGWRWRGRHAQGRYSASGNSAFDEYRAETLRRLEDEQREFVEYLERLRKAKDRAEFDQFMSERRNRPEPPPAAAPEAG